MSEKLTFVDRERWDNDYAYRIATAHSVVADLEAIDGYDAKVRYLEEIGFSPIGSHHIYAEGTKPSEGRCWQIVDEQGNEVEPVITVGLRSTAKTNQQVAELNEALFNYYRRYYNDERKKSPEDKSPFAITAFDELVSSYNKRFSATPMKEEFLKGEITKIDNQINQLSDSLRQAAQRAYNAILEIEPIDWAECNVLTSTLIKNDHLLTLVWDLVQYQLFLKGRVSQADNNVKTSFERSSKGAVPNSTKKKQAPVTTGLRCTLSEPQTTALFSLLSAGRYIDSTVTLAEFNKLLSGTEPVTNPLQWLKSNRDLAYLLNTMYEYKMIDSRLWQSQVEKRGLFLNEKKKPLKAQDLAQAKTDYLSKENPLEAGNIDIILEKVKATKD